MSRLDSAIRRLQAQRSCLNAASNLVRSVPGIVLELGLGNGRTYDHLRELMPEREIFVFERQIAAHPDCIPDQAHLFLGDLKQTLTQAVTRFAGSVALVHSDIGTGDGGYNAEIAAFLGNALGPVLCPGALVVSDQRIAIADCEPVDRPGDIQQDRYFMLRKNPSPQS